MDSRDMDEMERDGAITIDVGFGNITYARDGDGPFAMVIAELSIETAAGSRDKVEVSLRVASSPAEDTIVDLVERCRARLTTTLRNAASHLETRGAEELLFAESATPT